MVSPALALLSARNYRLLRRKGIAVCKTIDSLIATYCIENEHELLHADSHFDGYEKHLGLRVVIHNAFSRAYHHLSLRANSVLT